MDQYERDRDGKNYFPSQLILKTILFFSKSIPDVNISYSQ